MNGFLLALIILSACIFLLTNGFLDGGAMASTIFPNHSINPWVAVALIAVGEIVGLRLLGHQVLDLFAFRLVDFRSMIHIQSILVIVLSTFVAASIWNVGMWWLSFPSSSGHAMLGALCGASGVLAGWDVFAYPILWRVVLWLFLAPFLGVVMGFVSVRILQIIGSYLTSRWWPFFRFLQTVVISLIAMVHGSNDGQKTVALVWVACLAIGSYSVTLSSLYWGGGILLAMGVWAGAWRMQHQLASRFCRLQPLQALSAEGATTVCVGLSTFLGFSISTSQVLTNATLGSALAYQPKKIRWSYFSDLIRVWLTTLPASAMLAALVAKGLLYVVS